jgi:hypothetical protein
MSKTAASIARTAVHFRGSNPARRSGEMDFQITA